MLVIIVLFIIVANLIGCIRCEKKSLKVFLGISVSIWTIIAIIAGFSFYENKLKITEIDVSDSPDGEYELYFQQIGEPDWLFGYTRARLVLKDEQNVIVKYGFDLGNNGRNAEKEDWQVSWNEKFVSVVIFTDEQKNMQYDIYFDGTIE